MPSWWFCDGGCEALSLVGLILILLLLIFICMKCKLCMHMCWVVDATERERQVKLGLMDCKDERAPHHMRIAKTGDQRVAVRFFGTAHPDHTVRAPEIQTMKQANKQRADERRVHEIEKQLKQMQKPPLLARLRWWVRDTLAEPDTSRQRVHPMACAPEPVEIRSPASSPKAQALRDAANDSGEAQQVRTQGRLETSSWREPDKRHTELPASCSANKEAALLAARVSRGIHGTTATGRSTLGRSSTLRGLADSHRASGRVEEPPALPALTDA